MNKIKVLIIDDSALTRTILERIINTDAEIEVVGGATDPIVAAKKIQLLRPDVITLDIEMPRMNGLVFLKKLMNNSPLPVIIISGNSPKSSTNAIKALELGALEIIEKPDISTPEKLSDVSESICQAIKTSYAASPKNANKPQPAIIPFSPIISNNSLAKSSKVTIPSNTFFVIGSSTGGPQVLRQIFTQLKASIPGIVVAQHMPAMFTKSFADRLDMESNIKVVEACNNERIVNGKAIIIPGDYHGYINQDKDGFFIELKKTKKVNHHRPSIDVLFDSAAKVAGKKASGIILTGMGGDGAKGLLQLYERGAITIAQDEASSVVFGMPKRAVDLGGARHVKSPTEIIQIINEI